MARTRVKRVPVKVDNEQKLLTGLIVDDAYCSRVLAMVQPAHLESKYARRIVQWVRDYHAKYDKAPGKEIETIYRVNSPQIDETEASIIEGFLHTLSSQYEQDGRDNWEYQIDLARNYIRDRALGLLSDQVKVFTDRGDLEQAEGAVRDFIVTSGATSKWIQPLLDISLQHQMLDRQKEGLFRLEGAAGRVFGWWQRGWIIAFVGSEKKGKTWWLVEVATQAIIQGLRVAFFTLEMVDLDMTARFARHVTALPDQAGDILGPVWDCAHNQSDACDLRVRTNEEPIPLNNDGVPTWDEAAAYRPCTYCKDHPQKWLGEYKVASWFELSFKGDTFYDKCIDRTAAFAQQYGGANLWQHSYPRNSVGVDTIIAALDELQAVKDFTPDVVIVDYADILLAEGREEERHKLDTIWKRLAALAQERKIILVTASQAKSGARKQRSVKAGDYAEDYRKGATVDLAIGLNQMDSDVEGRSEKAQMVMRLSAMAVRHTAWPDEEVYVLQNLNLGQPAMDTFAKSGVLYPTED